MGPCHGPPLSAAQRLCRGPRRPRRPTRHANVAAAIKAGKASRPFSAAHWRSSDAIMTALAAPYLPPLLASAGLALVLALLSWRCPVRGSVSFALLMLAVAEWSALSALELAAPGMATKVACAKLEYI